MSTIPRIQMVVLDWAGTAVDFGCFAPVRPFRESLARMGIDITDALARGPMGLAKRDHLKALFEMADVSEAWLKRYGRPWTEADVQEAYEKHFMPLQLACVTECSRVVTGVVESVAWMHARGIKVGTTTGYFPEAAALAVETARGQGYRPDSTVCPAEVVAGRPAPWMIYRNMELLGIYPAWTVIKAGDTIYDIEEGANAGTWTVGVTDSSSEIGLTEQEFASLPDAERGRRTSAWAARLREAGAHEVIPTVAHLPAAIERIERRLAGGARPSDRQG